MHRAPPCSGQHEPSGTTRQRALDTLSGSKHHWAPLCSGHHQALDTPSRYHLALSSSEHLWAPVESWQPWAPPGTKHHDPPAGSRQDQAHYQALYTTGPKALGSTGHPARRQAQCFRHQTPDSTGRIPTRLWALSPFL